MILGDKPPPAPAARSRTIENMGGLQFEVHTVRRHVTALKSLGLRPQLSLSIQRNKYPKFTVFYLRFVAPTSLLYARFTSGSEVPICNLPHVEFVREPTNRGPMEDYWRRQHGFSHEANKIIAAEFDRFNKLIADIRKGVFKPVISVVPSLDTGQLTIVDGVHRASTLHSINSLGKVECRIPALWFA